MSYAVGSGCFVDGAVDVPTMIIVDTALYGAVVIPGSGPPQGATGTGRVLGPALFEDARRVLRRIQRRSVTQTPTPTPLAPWQFDMYVDAEVDGEATPEQLAVLQADPVAWRGALLALMRDGE